jgi:hypothetical protein
MSTTPPSSPVRAALDAATCAIDDAFPTDLPFVIAIAVAAGIRTLRRGDGTVDPVLLDELLHAFTDGSITAAALADALGEEELDDEELESAIADALWNDDDVAFLTEQHVGPIAVIASFGNADLEGMASGPPFEYFTVTRGDVVAIGQHSEDHRWEIVTVLDADDEHGLRAFRLAAAEEGGGLTPMTWYAQIDDLDDELRDLTFASGTMGDYWDRTFRGSDPDDLADEHAPRLAELAGIDLDTARARLVEIFGGTKWRSDAERQVVWEAWRARLAD